MSSATCPKVAVALNCSPVSTSAVLHIAMTAICLWLVLVWWAICTGSLLGWVFAKGGIQEHPQLRCIVPISILCEGTFCNDSSILTCCFCILVGWRLAWFLCHWSCMAWMVKVVQKNYFCSPTCSLGSFQPWTCKIILYQFEVVKDLSRKSCLHL